MISFPKDDVIPTDNSRRGFALVIVLVILTLLAAITIAYLSSMATERATANAFSNKARAEQAAQAGVDSAMGILRDYFKAFPDSVTAWDTAQSANSSDAVTKQGYPSTNEGTTLYLRAVPQANNTDLPDPAPGLADPDFNRADFAGGNGPNNVSPTTGVDNRAIYVLPLVSGAQVKPLASKSNALPVPVTDGSVSASAVDLNSQRKIGDTQGWLGSPPNYVHAPISSNSSPALPKPVPVPWVEIKQQDTTGLADPTKAPVVGRYAFWIEDESFRTNISYAGLAQDTNYLRADNNSNVALRSTDINLLGILDLILTPPAPPAADPNISFGQSILNVRANYPGYIFPEASAFTHTPGLSKDASDKLRYLTTSQSSALNLTRHGTQRLNINEVVYPPSNATFGTVQNQVDKIVKTIQFHAPNFGQRFYRIAPGQSGAAASTGIVTAPIVLNQMAVSHDATSTDPAGNHANIYDYKIAANIIDYLDADCLPTYVAAGGTVPAPSKPTLPFGDTTDNPYWAVGKDAAPFMQECATRFTGTSTPGGRYTLWVDYYVEFWNMSTKDIRPGDLGNAPFIRVAAPPKWVVANSVKYTPPKLPNGTQPADVAAYSDTTDVPPCDDPAYSTVSPSETRGSKTARDYDIDLANTAFADGTVFPAGKVTVITTDPNYAQIITDTEARKNVLVCKFLSQGKRYYTGPMPPNGASPLRSALGKDTLWLITENNSSSDYNTYVTIGNEKGYIDCLQGALNISYSGKITDPQGTTAAYPLIFGAVMRGNWTNTSSRATEGMQAAILGDPRTNNEQLAYNLTTGSAIDRSRYNNYEVAAVGNSPTMTVGSPDTGVYQTLGLPNYRSVRPNRPENPWPDFPVYYSDPSAPVTDYPTHQRADDELVLTAAKAPMPIANKTLTSIGQLGDVFDPSRMIDGGELRYSHGGGRSLKIGQHDDRWDGDETSASRTWAAWRLADIFGTTNAMQQPGLININGITRDNGAALRAALSGFRFQPDPASAPLGDPLLADPSTTSVASRLQIDRLLDELTTRLKRPLLDTTTSPISINTGTIQTGAGPLWERGELSELPGFGRSPDQIKPDRTTGPTTYPQTELVNTSPVTATSIDMSKHVFDRGREELFRRMVEMTTTRGNVFTVYVLGQAINQTDPNDSKSKRVTGMQQLKVTFRLVPKQKSTTGAGYTDFHPGTNDSGQSVDFNPKVRLDDRFAKPDHYDVEILSASSGNS